MKKTRKFDTTLFSNGDSYGAVNQTECTIFISNQFLKISASYRFAFWRYSQKGEKVEKRTPGALRPNGNSYGAEIQSECPYICSSQCLKISASQLSPFLRYSQFRPLPDYWNYSNSNTRSKVLKSIEKCYRRDFFLSSEMFQKRQKSGKKGPPGISSRTEIPIAIKFCQFLIFEISPPPKRILTLVTPLDCILGTH